MKEGTVDLITAFIEITSRPGALKKVPTATIEAAKLLILDTIGVGWAGASEIESRAAFDIALDEGGKPESYVWGTRAHLPSRSTAFVNGVFSAGLDFDSVHLGSITHSAIVVIPAVMAVAEARHIDGKRALLAIIAGMELSCWLSQATARTSGWFETSVYGTFGAALGASLVMDLDKERVQHALGLSLSLAGGTKQSIVERTLSKRYQSAFAAQSGVLAAQLAERGVSAPSRFLTGESGFCRTFDEIDLALVEANFGRSFLTDSTGVKPVPVCYCSIAAVEAVAALNAGRTFTPSDIAAVTVTISPYIYETVGRPFDPSSNPKVAGMFSVQYAVASSLIRGALKLEHITESAVRDPDVGRLARSISVKVNEAWTGAFAPTEVRVALNDGRICSHLVENEPALLPCAASQEQILQKFRDCLSVGEQGLSSADSNKLIAAIQHFDTLDDCGRLFAQFKS